MTASQVFDDQRIDADCPRYQAHQSLGRFIGGFVAALGVLGAFLVFVHAA